MHDDLSPAERAILRAYRAQQKDAVERNLDAFLSAWALTFAMLLVALGMMIGRGEIVLP